MRAEVLASFGLDPNAQDGAIAARLREFAGLPPRPARAERDLRWSRIVDGLAGRLAAEDDNPVVSSAEFMMTTGRTANHGTWGDAEGRLAWAKELEQEDDDRLSVIIMADLLPRIHARGLARVPGLTQERADRLVREGSLPPALTWT